MRWWWLHNRDQVIQIMTRKAPQKYGQSFTALALAWHMHGMFGMSVHMQPTAD
jgi:hypothetical protein